MQRKFHEDAIRKTVQSGEYEEPFSPELYRLALEVTAPNGWDGIDREAFGKSIAAGNKKSQQQESADPMHFHEHSVNVQLKYKKGWSDKQKAAADAKLKICSEADTVKSEVIRGNQKKLRSQLKKTLGIKKIPEGYDVDHVIDLQIGGRDDMMNTQLLDRSVNRSLGAQIQHAIKDYEIGTPLGKFTIK